MAWGTEGSLGIATAVLRGDLDVPQAHPKFSDALGGCGGPFLGKNHVYGRMKLDNSLPGRRFDST